MFISKIPAFGSYIRFCKSLRQYGILAFLALAACSAFPRRPADAVVGASDSRVQDAGVAVLQKGGNAADAMVAMMMTGGVVMPSRAGLGSGGICQVLDPNEGNVKTLNFLHRKNNGMGMPALAKELRETSLVGYFE